MVRTGQEKHPVIKQLVITRLCVCVHSEVSCKTLEGVEGLKKLIYQVASSMKESSSTVFGKLVGRLVSNGWPLLMI